MNWFHERESWPRASDGRFLCTSANPMPWHIGDAHNERWAHDRIKDDGELVMQCMNCNQILELEHQRTCL